MLVACLGVANVIVAGIQARQFEFGVLRALGAQRGLLGRLVLGEAILIAAAACILGTFMGLQGAFGGLQVYRALLGLSLSLPVHVPAIAIGCAAVFAITLGAAVPSAARLVRKPPRELLAAMKG
ncbi:MAG: ABC transporter permease [Phycisphaerae bacterium]|nr:ABC transporter permease [Phycisphaerae bacterium]